MKVFSSRFFEDGGASRTAFEREVSMMCTVSHPNILRFFGCSLCLPRIAIVMEYCENGDICKL